MSNRREFIMVLGGVGGVASRGGAQQDAMATIGFVMLFP
jgi:hypothetical protein